ncbi:hypothetical protein ES703_108823 [subsurface metagenome]
MTTGLPQIQFGNVRSVYNIIAPLDMFILPEIFNNPADYRPLGMPVNQPRTSLFMKTKQVEFPT